MTKKQVNPSKTRNIYRVIGTLVIPLLHSAPEVRNIYRKRITIKKQAQEGRHQFSEQGSLGYKQDRIIPN